MSQYEHVVRIRGVLYVNGNTVRWWQVRRLWRYRNFPVRTQGWCRSAYRRLIINDAPLQHWPLDEASGIKSWPYALSTKEIAEYYQEEWADE